jgi:hypothetical protein
MQFLGAALVCKSKHQGFKEAKVGLQICLREIMLKKS